LLKQEELSSPLWLWKSSGHGKQEFIMKFIDTGNPDTMQTRRGGGLALIFGLPFLLFGLFIVSLSFGWFNSKGTPPPWFVSAIFGSVFTLIGVALTFGRSGMVIDRRKRTIMYWYGLLVPMKKTFRHLHYYNRITVEKDLRRAEKRTYYAYPIVLKGSRDASEGIVFDEPTDYPEARRTAEEIATFLKLPLADTTSGKEVIREPEKLSESVRERAKRTGERVVTLDPPPGMTARVREEFGTLIIEIPPQKVTIEHYKRMAILAIIGFAAAFVFLGGRNLLHLRPHELMLYVPIGLCILLFVSRPIRHQRSRSYRIKASRDMLRVEKRSSNRLGVTEIPVDELEDFVMGDADLPGGVSRTPDGSYRAVGQRVPHRKPGSNPNQQVMAGTKLLAKFSLIIDPPGPSLTASSDKATVNFGKGLREDELRYLYALIKKKITE